MILFLVHYIVYQYNDNIDEGLLYIYLRLTAELPEDDFDNGLAYNGMELIEDNSLNGDIINIADVQSLREGSSLNINIYNYVHGVKSNDSFVLTAYDVPPVGYYVLDETLGNEFVLTNIKQYGRAPLKLEFKNLTTNDLTIVYVWLGGAL